MPVDPSQLNAVGDLVVTEPAPLRALADPETRRLLGLVERLGPATTAPGQRLLRDPGAR